MTHLSVPVHTPPLQQQQLLLPLQLMTIRVYDDDDDDGDDDEVDDDEDNNNNNNSNDDDDCTRHNSSFYARPPPVDFPSSPSSCCSGASLPHAQRSRAPGLVSFSRAPVTRRAPGRVFCSTLLNYTYDLLPRVTVAAAAATIVIPFPPAAVP